MGRLHTFFDQLQDACYQTGTLEERLGSAFAVLVDGALGWWRVLLQKFSIEGMTQARQVKPGWHKMFRSQKQVVGSLAFCGRLLVLQLS